MGIWRHNDIAQLGFGCMRLPQKRHESEEEIDLDEFCQMVDLFLEAGFTYFDTARGYHNGDGEGALKKALVDRYPRESFQLATKLSAFLAPNAQKAQEMFFISLEDTKAGYFDRYLLHNLGGSRTQSFNNYGIWDFVTQQKSAGLIEELGFSFHDSAEALELLLQEHTNMDFVQLQINYADWDDEFIQARACYEVAQNYDLDVLVMEPVKGGLLVDLPFECAALFDGFNEGAALATPVSYALRFAASLKGVSTVLSGMSNLEQMKENIAIMSKAQPVKQDERALLKECAAILHKTKMITCTRCGYCTQVCPQGIRIPQVCNALNVYTIYGDLERARQSYLWALPGKASLCIACGACERVCPQKLSIRVALEAGASLLETSAGQDIQFD